MSASARGGRPVGWGMRRAGLVLLSLAFTGCGARTGLVGEFVEAGASLEAGDTHSPDASEQADAREPRESSSRLCPPTPPDPMTTCEASASSILCAYIDDAIGGIRARCCEFGGWTDCTTVAFTQFTSCSDVVCTSGVDVECIEGNGECCECSADMSADECGPC